MFSKFRFGVALAVFMLCFGMMATGVSAAVYEECVAITGSAGTMKDTATTMSAHEVYSDEELGVLTSEQAELFDDLSELVLSAKTRYSQKYRNSGVLKLIDSVENGSSSDETYYFDCSSFVSTLCYELYGFDCNIYEYGNAYTTNYFYSDRTNFSAEVYKHSSVDPSTLKKGQLLLNISKGGSNHVMFCCGDSKILHCSGSGVVCEKIEEFDYRVTPGKTCSCVLVLTPICS